MNMKQKEYEFLISTNFDLINDNHFRDRIDMVIKLSLESIKVAKHEIHLVSTLGYKLKTEKENSKNYMINRKKVMKVWLIIFRSMNI